MEINHLYLRTFLYLHMIQFIQEVTEDKTEEQSG